MGRNNGDFFDGGSCARMDSLGAMDTSNKMDGPADNVGNGTEPAGIAGNGMGSH